MPRWMFLLLAVLPATSRAQCSLECFHGGTPTADCSACDGCDDNVWNTTDQCQTCRNDLCENGWPEQETCRCVCGLAWTGQRCEISSDRCELHCFHGGHPDAECTTCIDCDHNLWNTTDQCRTCRDDVVCDHGQLDDDTCECVCDLGWTGDRCDMSWCNITISADHRSVWAHNFTADLGNRQWLIHDGATMLRNTENNNQRGAQVVMSGPAKNVYVVLSGGNLSCDPIRPNSYGYRNAYYVQSGGTLDTNCIGGNHSSAGARRLMYETGANILWPYPNYDPDQGARQTQIASGVFPLGVQSALQRTIPCPYGVLVVRGRTVDGDCLLDCGNGAADDSCQHCVNCTEGHDPRYMCRECVASTHVMVNGSCVIPTTIPPSTSPTSSMPTAAPTTPPTMTSPSASPASSAPTVAPTTPQAATAPSVLPASSAPTPAPTGSPTTTTPSASPASSAPTSGPSTPPTTTTGVTTPDPCSATLCSDECDQAPCGWDSVTDRCRTGFVTSATDGAACIEAVAGGCPALADASREEDDSASSIAWVVIILLILSAALLGVWYTRRRHRGKAMDPKERTHATDPDGKQRNALALNPTYAAALPPTSAYDIVPEFAPVYVTTEFAPVYVTAEAEARGAALANPTYEAAEVRATASATVTDGVPDLVTAAAELYCVAGAVSLAAPETVYAGSSNANEMMQTHVKMEADEDLYMLSHDGAGNGGVSASGAEARGAAALAKPTYEAAVADPGSASSAAPSQIGSPAPGAYGSLGTTEQQQAHAYDSLGTGQDSGSKAPAQQHSYSPAESSSNVYQLPDDGQDQYESAQYALVDEGGSSGDPEYASVEYAYQDADDTSSSTGDHGVYAVPSPAGNSHLGMQVVRVAEDEFC